MRKHTILLWASVALMLASCLTIVLLLVLPAQPQETQPTQPPQIVRYDLIITEVCTKNETLIRDRDGRYRDYIELYNAGATVNLAGLRLSDGKTVSQPLTDSVLNAGAYTVIFLADELTGFALGAAGGDQLQLLDGNGNIVQQLVTVPLEMDQVMLYGSNGYTVSDQASPGFSNDERGVQLYRYGEPETNPKLVISELSQKLDEAGMHYEIDGRPKHLYSIYRKMVIQNKPFDQIYDLIAIRVIVDTIPECYTVLGIAHTLWNQVPGRFKDYISVPKANTVAVVGTRGCTPYGIAVAEKLSYELTAGGAIVVSGLAKGIDAAATRGALRACVPPENKISIISIPF